MTTKAKLQHIAAQITQLSRELDALARTAPDISFFASHELGVADGVLQTAARLILKQAAKLND